MLDLDTRWRPIAPLRAAGIAGEGAASCARALARPAEGDMIIGAADLASGAAGAKPALAQAVRPDAGVVPRSDGAAPISARSATAESITGESGVIASMAAAFESDAPQRDRVVRLVDRFRTRLDRGELAVCHGFWDLVDRSTREPGPISPKLSARRPSRACGESPLT
ncbi:hypothetical protein [Nocardia xishanensis]|uniref:Uncharacterized protein n=1 Tax=Nocardia xishanensis TaxID=238964 RepID=A0ABW7X217_9NOCA